MEKDDVWVLIRKIAIIPAVKVLSGDDAHFAAEAVTHGGIPIVAITMIVPGEVGLIAHLCRSQGKVAVGAGTVLDVETARKCIDAGACFLTSPNFNPAIVEFAAKENMAVVPGAPNAEWGGGGLECWRRLRQDIPLRASRWRQLHQSVARFLGSVFL